MASRCYCFMLQGLRPPPSLLKLCFNYRVYTTLGFRVNNSFPPPEPPFPSPPERPYTSPGQVSPAAQKVVNASSGGPEERLAHVGHSHVKMADGSFFASSVL